MATSTLYDTAVAQMVSMLPTGNQLRPVRRTTTSIAVAHVARAVVATFIGSPSADFAVILVDVDALTVAAEAGRTVAVVDLLSPALEAAASGFGAGVLGPVHTEDSTALFADVDTVIYELLAGNTVAGWFGMRIRDNGALSGGSSLSDDAVAQRLGRINDVEMALTVEIGRTRMPVRDVLGLEPGAVIELDRSAGSPADILLNGRLIAHGEVVVVDQDYAVRVTRILDIPDGLV
ncbi:MAG TPA: flagellar motor switch protein FliN [Glaciihabitans sp.]|jgi:flagellar motor switch protein FliN/FliY|nr:flagellar motor switch protein FliN [Glaciihabitans sp.]